MSMARKRPSMVDVARESGTSLKTVSRVVNGVPTVNEDMRRRVLEAIDRLGYRHNLAAAGLRSKSASRVIGLVNCDLTDPFFATLGATVDEEARRRGYQVIMSAAKEDPELGRTVALELCRRQVMGLLVVPVGDDLSYLREEMDSGTAVVCVDRPAGGIEADSVVVDNRGVARRLAEALIERGHTRIAVFSGRDDIYTHRERRAGMREALAAHGLDDPALHVAELYTPESSRAALERIMAQPDPPTAVICTNNRLGYGVIDWVNVNGAAVDVGVFDRMERDSLTGVRPVRAMQNPGRLGEIAIERLFARIEGLDEEPQTICVPVEISD
ncbi:LacI family transcriptional regulator [Actinomyces ruminis]|uniref:LacI family transcriptional regulator n=2 Tax=Actinomyces ruminis TaxID=1937003 RepID=A0ABX4MDF6_9ACTO|nr:LacI family transcriptional regulator [Actinomyces ruminis]